VSGADGIVQSVAAATLAPMVPPTQVHTKAVTASETASIRNRRLVVTGNSDGSVQAYALERLLTDIERKNLPGSICGRVTTE
jgi:hypothetical protein